MIFHPGYLGISASNIDNETQATLTVISSDAKGVIFELTTPGYEITPGNDDQQVYQLIDIPGLDQISEVGKPQLPVKGLLIGVPSDAEFTLNILEDETEVIQGEFNIQPVGKSEGLIEDFSPGPIVYLPDESVYQSASLFPESATLMGETAWIREQRVLQVSVYPFQYIPAEKSLVWHKRLRVEINFIGSESSKARDFDLAQMNEVIQESPFEATFKSQLINYEDAKNWRSDKASTSIQGSAITSTNVGFDQTESLGPRYKIVIDEDGIYRLTHDALDSVHEITGTDIDELEMINQGRKVAIYIEDDNDNGIFDSGDSIVFYGQKYYGDYLAEKYSNEDDLWLTYSQQLSDGSYVDWTPEMNATMMEKYTDDNVYWLTIGTDISRMPIIDGTPQGSTVPETYTTTVHAEQSKHWFTWNFSSEDTWFWESIRYQITRTYTTTLSAIATTPFTAKLSGEAASRVKSNLYNPDHHTKIWLNSQTTPVIDETWDGISRYYFSSGLPSTYLKEGENSLKFQVLFDAYYPQYTDWIYFDWFEIEYSRTFQAENDLLQFERDESGLDWTYEISNCLSSDVIVLDVTDPLTPTYVMSATIAGNVASFEGLDHAGNANYIMAGDSAILTPKSLTYNTPPTSDLFNTGNQADYIFVTHNDFLAGTQTLANYRASQGLTTRIIDIDDLIDEFNYGIYNPLAIKNFLRYTFAYWQTPAPSYVLLVGDGHWNFKKYPSEYGTQTVFMPPYLSWVDPEQGEVDATNDLATIVGTDALPDVHIARLPVTTTSELSSAIQKILAYESSGPYRWKQHFLFVADDTPDTAGDFTGITEDLISDYFSTKFAVNRVLLDDFDGICTSSGDHDCIEATDAFTESLNTDGALVVNYIGHGWNTYWASETIFMKEDIGNLNNGDMLPILISLTCRDGYWYHPGTTSNSYGYETSLAEALIRADDKGMVGTFSPTGLGDVIGHDSLQRGFYDALLIDGVRELGAATQEAKLRLASSEPNSDQIHSFVVFGDPALKIQLPAVAYLPMTIR